MGRGNSKTAKAVHNNLKTRGSDSSEKVKNLFTEIKDSSELMRSLEPARNDIEKAYVSEVISRIPENWREGLDDSSTPEAVETRLKAFLAYDKYRIDPYRLQRKSIEHLGVGRRPYVLALDTLVREESEPFVEPLEKAFDKLDDKDKPKMTSEEVAKETMLLIYASKNTYAPKPIRKAYMGRLSQKAAEAVVEVFASYSYTPPADEKWPV